MRNSTKFRFIIISLYTYKVEYFTSITNLRVPLISLATTDSVCNQLKYIMKYGSNQTIYS